MLFYYILKKLKDVFASAEFQIQWTSFVTTDYLTALKLFCFLSSVATDGKNRSGLKLENLGPFFSSFGSISSKLKSTKNYMIGSL